MGNEKLIRGVDMFAMLNELLDTLFPGVPKDVRFEAEEDYIPDWVFNTIAEGLARLASFPVRDVYLDVPPMYDYGYITFGINKEHDKLPRVDIFLVYPSGELDIVFLGPEVNLGKQCVVPIPPSEVLPIPNIMYSVPPGLEKVAKERLGVDLALLGNILNTLRGLQPGMVMVNPLFCLSVGCYNPGSRTRCGELVVFVPPSEESKPWIYEWYDIYTMPYIAVSETRPLRAYTVEKRDEPGEYVVWVDVLRSIEDWLEKGEPPRTNKYVVKLGDVGKVKSIVAEKEEARERELKRMVHREIRKLFSEGLYP